MLYPTIGVPLMGNGILRRYEQYQYTRCLRNAGASVQLLAPHAFSGAVDAALAQCDGFLFPGGPDIRPELYGQAPMPSCKEPDPARDDFELLLLRAVLEAHKPLFCIGRGMQLLNIIFGGTLMQDIRLKQEYQHLDLLHRTTATHPIDIDPNSLLAYLLDTDTLSVNSLHHQAVDAVGESLWVPADSPEGFAEALELDDHPFCLAVQWHPESMARRTPAQQQLFRAFVNACR